MNAYLDQCAPADPRVPLIDDMRAIIRRAYYVTTADTDD
jgi:acetaldehyde dehydrogenase/alcohol dehydrogenase